MASLGPLFSNILKNIFVDYSQTIYPLTHFQLCKGNIPLTTTVNGMPTADTLGSAFTALSGSNFTAPVNGASNLISPVTIPIKAGVTNQTATYMRGVWSSDSYPLMTIDVSASSSASAAKFNQLTVSTGNTIQLTGLNFSLQNTTDTLLSTAFYNNILAYLLGKTTGQGYTNSLMFGYPKVYNVSTGAEVNAVLAVEAYDGVVPTDPEAAGGNLLWKSTIATTSTSYLEVNGSCISSTRQLTANATATGTATYIRIIKNAITTGGTVYPKLTMQLKVGVNCFFNTPNMVTGQSNTLEQFNVLILS